MSEERNNQQVPEMELSEILQVRRDKLADKIRPYGVVPGDQGQLRIL